MARFTAVLILAAVSLIVIASGIQDVDARRRDTTQSIIVAKLSYWHCWMRNGICQKKRARCAGTKWTQFICPNGVCCIKKTRRREKICVNRFGFCVKGNKCPGKRVSKDASYCGKKGFTCCRLSFGSESCSMRKGNCQKKRSRCAGTKWTQFNCYTGVCCIKKTRRREKICIDKLGFCVKRKKCPGKTLSRNVSYCRKRGYTCCKL